MAKNEIYEVIEIVTTAMRHVGIEYAITGSVASSIHGDPVTTQDVDVIVRMTEPQARRLAQALPPRFYRNEDSLAAAARDGGMINVIDMDTTFKVDLSVVSLTAFHRSVFDRRHTIEMEPGTKGIDIVSPEDIILMKLLWRKDSQSTKQWENALSVARRQNVSMDWKYLFEQAKALGLERDLIKLRDEAGI